MTPVDELIGPDVCVIGNGEECYWSYDIEGWRMI